MGILWSVMRSENFRYYITFEYACSSFLTQKFLFNRSKRPGLKVTRGQISQYREKILNLIESRQRVQQKRPLLLSPQNASVQHKKRQK